ncbi:hypothetical protein CH29_gp06 [Achromobacter phage JWAlpha]|uniref:Uncharacterized protein n=1 Tax=Achromobacter phage JWAlpha TaxID=1416009 RepID=V9VEE6_9CAUD|nr:hypothetical protein CH29_gp06 [Achromobacter phage JWAlpha]AHC93959.1 hypothetical protein JJJB_0006 [Achromobacter phage JWAlpha]
MKTIIIALGLLFAANTLAAENTHKDAMQACIVQGEYASTLQQLRQKHSTMSLGVALEVIDGEFRGPKGQKKMLYATAEYVFSYGRWADHEDVSNAVLAYCIRGSNAGLKNQGTK